MKNNEKIIIIGGSSGMGLAAAQAAAKQGYSVVIASRKAKKLEAALSQIDSANVSAEIVDTLDAVSLKHLFETVGAFDHLVIAGSEVRFGDFKSLPLEAAKYSFDSKFWGPYQAIQLALPFLKPQGSIILFSGSAGQRPEFGTELMSSLNSAVEGLSRALAISLAPIRVNTIAPGLVDTPVYANLDANLRQSIFNGFGEKLLIKRPGRPEEIASSVLYLLQSTYTTGTTLLVDGGHVLR